MRLLWRERCGGWIRSAAATRDRVFLGDEDTGVLLCRDAATGAKLWQLDAGAPVRHPRIAGDILVVATSRGALGVTLEGEVAWKLETPFACFEPTFDGASIYVWSAKTSLASASEGVIYRLDPRSGKVAWKTSAYGGAHTPARIVVRDGRTWGVNYEGVVFCLDAEGGKEIWRRETRMTFGSPDLGADRLFAKDMFGQVRAFSTSDGTLLWESPALSHPGEGSGVSVSNGRVLYGENDGTIYCLSADTGAVVWSFHAADAFFGPDEEPLVIGRFVFCLKEGVLTRLGLDDGKVTARLDLEDRRFVLTRPVYARGRVFCLIKDTLYAVELEPPPRLY